MIAEHACGLDKISMRQDAETTTFPISNSPRAMDQTRDEPSTMRERLDLIRQLIGSWRASVFGGGHVGLLSLDVGLV
jgi:hypothetical protein